MMPYTLLIKELMVYPPFRHIYKSFIYYLIANKHVTCCIFHNSMMKPYSSIMKELLVHYFYIQKMGCTASTRLITGITIQACKATPQGTAFTKQDMACHDNVTYCIHSGIKLAVQYNKLLSFPLLCHSNVTCFINVDIMHHMPIFSY